MAGKKKKSLANKLAKMSDEERARYLQHRAEIEEEAKRRKEQLIATFMKKKIKKEDAFARLNLAKINQNWHQILRKIKVKEMKDEVEHLKSWIERLVNYKNNRIAKLLEELEDAEEQYSNNFKYNSSQLDTLIDLQNDYINGLQREYEQELDVFLKDCGREENEIIENAQREIIHLKTIMFGQNVKAEKELKERKENYSQQLYAVEYNNKLQLDYFRKTRGEVEKDLCKNLLEIVQLYVQNTDVRRSHLQELRRIDAESAEEIRTNEERINSKEALIKSLTSEHNYIKKVRSEKIKNYQIEEKALKEHFLELKKDLKNDLLLDELKLRILTSNASHSISFLSDLVHRGKQIVSLSETCRKFETTREKLSKWLPMNDLVLIGDIDGGYTDDEKLYKKTVQEEFTLPRLASVSRSITEEKTLTRPTTSSTSKLIKLSSMETDFVIDELETKTNIAAIEEVKFETKKSYPSTSEMEVSEKPKTSDDEESKVYGERDILERCYKNLEKMEKFWVRYNKVEVDIMELKEERSLLETENKRLRGFLRGVLEAAALSKSIPESRVSTAVRSRRTAYSAPMGRISFF